MTELREPERLNVAESGADEVQRELVAGLRSAREVGPSAEQRARMRAALGLPPVATRTPSSTPPRASIALKLIAALLVLGAGLGVKLALEARTAQNVPPASAPVHDAAPAPVAGGPGLEPPVVPSAAQPASQPTPPPSTASRPRPRVAPKPEAPEAETPAQPPRPSIEAELLLLRRARAHVRSAPATALALVAEHERDFARGSLIEEREVIAIEALLASDRRADAGARASRFLAQYTRSAHARRVHALLAEHGLSAQE